MTNIQKFHFNIFQENTMVLVKDGPECIVADPGYYTDAEREAFWNYLNTNGLRPVAVLLTHAHLDHILGAGDVQERCGGIPVYMNPCEASTIKYNYRMAGKLGIKMPEKEFTPTDAPDGTVVEAAGMRFEAIHTPGHTPGGTCWLERGERFMLTGDTLFAGTIGRTDLEGGDYDKLIVSVMDRLMGLDGDIRILPGHGGESSIARERTTNPFLEPFNEPEELQNGEE